MLYATSTTILGGRVEFGALYDLRNPPQWRIPSQRLYAETLDHIQAVEEMGLPAVWVTEHHFIDDDYLPSCLTFAAAIAARTRRVTIGTAVLLLPLHDPLRVAEDAAVVDILSDGRLRLGLGLGYKVEEFEAFGIDRASRARRMDEGIEIIRHAWADGAHGYDGRHYQFPPVDVTPKPVQRPGPQIWLAGRGDKPAERAARVGDGFIATPQPDVMARYVALRNEHGRTGPANLCTFAFSLPADDPDRAAAELGQHATYRMDAYTDWYGTAADLPVDQRVVELAEQGRALRPHDFFKTPDETVAQLRDLEQMGVTSLLFFAGFPGAPMSATLPMFQSLVDHVMPAFAPSSDAHRPSAGDLGYDLPIRHG